MKSNCVFKDLSAFICKHKLIFILVGALLVVTTAVALILLLPGDNPPPTILGDRPDPNPITGGEEERVYYYDLPEEEAILTLYENWTFTMSGPWLNKSGEYSLDDDGSLILDFTRNIDGVATATADGRTVVMLWDGATLTFREKIGFAVSFNSNGGSKVASIPVTNGKTVSAPEAPTKDGCTFEGWYTDEALTKPFNFDVTLITEDITLYAKWS